MFREASLPGDEDNPVLKNRILSINVPNLLTVLRILLAPVLVILLLRELHAAALVVFVVAGVSDALDGLIARWFNQRTLMGAYLDPVADKLLLGSAYVSVAVLKLAPAWLTVIVLARETIILVGVVVLAINHVSFEVRPSPISKCTTTFQIAAIILVLCLPLVEVPPLLNTVCFWVAAGLTVASGLHYIAIGLNLLQTGLEDR